MAASSSGSGSTGYRPYEFEGLGVAYEERRVMMQEEAVPLILQGFFDKRVNADGKYFKIRMDEQADVFPQPIQQPHPPIYMAAGARAGPEQLPSLDVTNADRGQCGRVCSRKQLACECG